MINHLKSAKNIFLLNDKDGFSNLKIQLFNILDAARDVLLSVESAQYRLGGNPHKINRYISKRADWYYQHKYSVRTATNCAADKKTVEEGLAKLTLAYQKFYSQMVPKIGNNVKGILKNDHDDKVAEVKRYMHPVDPKPVQPKFPKWESPAELD